jgi:hypothetical protein
LINNKIVINKIYQKYLNINDILIFVFEIFLMLGSLEIWLVIQIRSQDFHTQQNMMFYFCPAFIVASLHGIKQI